MPSIEKNEFLLTQLVLMFQTAALQHMGKLKNPMTDKTEQDLPQAQISIDMLEMIHSKMKGNLSSEEERLLSSVLQDLRLNYVDEVMKAQNPTSQSAAPTTNPDPPQSS